MIAIIVVILGMVACESTSTAPGDEDEFYGVYRALLAIRVGDLWPEAAAVPGDLWTTEIGEENQARTVTLSLDSAKLVFEKSNSSYRYVASWRLVSVDSAFEPIVQTTEETGTVIVSPSGNEVEFIQGVNSQTDSWLDVTASFYLNSLDVEVLDPLLNETFLLTFRKRPLHSR